MKIVTEPKQLLTPVLKSKSWAGWQSDHKEALAASQEQRNRAEAFAQIFREAEATLENRATADPRALVRASSDLRAAQRERQACEARAAEIEKLAILESPHAKETLELAVQTLVDAGRDHREALAAGLTDLGQRFGVVIEMPPLLKTKPELLLASFDSGPERIENLWYLLQ